jgi:3',5'-cyclic-AMP phosphodiesterase
MVHVYADRLVNTVVPLADVPEITGYPSDVRAQVEALTPEERHEMFARKNSDFNTAGESHRLPTPQVEDRS